MWFIIVYTQIRWSSDQQSTFDNVRKYNFSPGLYFLLPLKAISKFAEERLFSAT